MQIANQWQIEESIKLWKALVDGTIGIQTWYCKRWRMEGADESDELWHLKGIFNARHARIDVIQVHSVEKYKLGWSIYYLGGRVFQKKENTTCHIMPFLN